MASKCQDAKLYAAVFIIITGGKIVNKSKIRLDKHPELWYPYSCCEREDSTFSDRQRVEVSG